MVRFSPNSQILATGSWSGGVKLWNVPNCTPLRSLRGKSPVIILGHQLQAGIRMKTDELCTRLSLLVLKILSVGQRHGLFTECKKFQNKTFVSKNMSVVKWFPVFNWRLTAVWQC